MTIQDELLPTTFERASATDEAAPSGLRRPPPIELVGGPATRTAMVDCACGGRYRIDRHHPARYVANHVRSNQHGAWRAREGL